MLSFEVFEVSSGGLDIAVELDFEILGREVEMLHKGSALFLVI